MLDHHPRPMAGIQAVGFIEYDKKGRPKPTGRGGVQGAPAKNTTASRMYRPGTWQRPRNFSLTSQKCPSAIDAFSLRHAEI
jgi:hypothetical protein